MTRRAYVDTTIVTDALLKWQTVQAEAIDALQSFDETLLPDYAVREFQAGPLQNYIYTHNCFVGANSCDEARERVDAIAPTQQRNKFLTAIGALKGIRTATENEYKRIIAAREMNWEDGEKFRVEFIKTHIANKIFDAVYALDTVCMDRTDRLSCLESVEVEEHGEKLRARGGRTDCAEKATCGLTTLLLGQEEALRKVLAATEEQNAGAPKAELKRRMAALLPLLEGRGAERATCRGLGDAVFAVLAPEGATILTTNVNDHRPLAECLGKSVAGTKAKSPASNKSPPHT
jgi:hypothetical protein